MKNTLKFAAVALIAVFVFACSGGNGPETTAKAYLDALNAEDFDKAKEFATEDTKGMLDFMKQIATMGGEKKEAKEKKEIKDLKCTVEGDTTAVCTYMAADKEEKLNLKKSGEKWLVHMPKENPMGGGEEGGAMEGEMGAADTSAATAPAEAAPAAAEQH